MRDTTSPDRDEAPDDAARAASSRAADVPVIAAPFLGGTGVLTGSARLHADRSAARRARALMAEWLVSWWGPATADPPARAGLRDRLAVVLSELVSNAVVHGRHRPDGPSQLEVELHEFGRTVRLVVADRSRRPGEPAFRPPAAPTLPDGTADSGRGLFIVDQLADIWHAQPVSDGLVVWCDFALDDAPPTG